MVKRVNKLHLFLTVFLFILCGFLISGKINFFAADLGRYIKNGEEILSSQTEVLRNNYYSYTYPDYPFVNHHWGSGVVLYVVHHFFGFVGLSGLFVLITLVTFWLFFDTANKSSSFTIAFLVSLIFLPVITNRQEIRPEVFSYFFCGLFWWTLSAVKNKKISEKWLFVLPAVQVLWTNLHIYFFWGFLLTTFFGVESFLKEKTLFKRLLVIFFLQFVASCFNPAGLKGFFYPLSIFNNYGYRVLENQSVWFIDRVLGKYPPNLYFKIAFVLLLGSWVLAIKKKQISVSNILLFLFISYLGWSVIRNFSVFAFFGLGIVSANIGDLKLFKDRQSEKEIFVTISFAMFILFSLFILNPSYWLSRKFGWGLGKNIDASVNFFQKNNLKGPVFNNYDIGGYLIYFLFPSEKVFVDNRPEAYPKDFFTDIYIPMQENQAVWQKVDQKYNFNSVFFYRNDLTPWGQQFLAAMIQNPSWAPVYVDQYCIIFLKRNEQNKGVIEKYELPKSMFTIAGTN